MENRKQPIWGVLVEQGRSLKWLARKTGYSYAHIVGVKAGAQNLSAPFRRRCAEALDIPESVLFRLEEPAEVA